MAPTSEKNFIPKEYLQSRKVPNAPNLISQSEPPAPKEIMMNPKMRTDVSVLSVATGAIVFPEKHIPRKKNNMKSLAMLPQRNDPIPNQDDKILGTKKTKLFHHN